MNSFNRLVRCMDHLGDKIVSDVLNILPGPWRLFSLSFCCWMIFSTGVACMLSNWAFDAEARQAATYLDQALGPGQDPRAMTDQSGFLDGGPILP